MSRPKNTALDALKKATKEKRSLIRAGLLPEEEPHRELTEEEHLYVQARAKGIGHTSACRAAGWSPKSYPAAHQLEIRPSIREALKKERAAYARQANVSRKDVIDGLTEAINQAKLQADPMAQIAGWREVAKICGHYAPEVKKIELDGTAKRMLQKFETLSDAELLEYASGDIIDAECVEVPEE